MLNEILFVLNAVAMAANLFVYGFVSQTPATLAMGILCGFVFLGFMIEKGWNHG